MFLPRLSFWSVITLALLVPHLLSAQIRADVQVAGAVNGSFTIELEHTKTPTTVANFIGLATGQRPWIDLTTGAIRQTPFYNGVTFHRVIGPPLPFMSQTGSRNGLGTDGPGYSFKDEFDSTLRHDGPYVVSMANSGKHTNGSQFFITASAQPGLDDKHSVFGRVIAGQSVVDAINATPTGPGDVPVTPVVIQSISVHGPSLAGFDLFPSTLATIRDARPVLTRSGAAYTLGYDAHAYCAYTGYHGADLATWSNFKSSYDGGVAPSGLEDVTAHATGSRHFFRLARIDYSTTPARFLHADLANRSFTFTSNFVSRIVVNIDGTGAGGTWSLPDLNPPTSGALQTVTYATNTFLGEIYLRFSSSAFYGFDIQFRPLLDYRSANAGAFSGPMTLPAVTTITGTFTTTP